MMRCCLDKRVWAVVGIAAVALLIADPRLGWTALPVLAGLACPVSMLLMMRRMSNDRAGAAQAPGTGQPEAGRAAEIARLRQEIEQLKAHAAR